MVIAGFDRRKRGNRYTMPSCLTKDFGYTIFLVLFPQPVFDQLDYKRSSPKRRRRPLPADRRSALEGTCCCALKRACRRQAAGRYVAVPYKPWRSGSAGPPFSPVVYVGHFCALTRHKGKTFPLVEALAGKGHTDVAVTEPGVAFTREARKRSPGTA